MSATVVDTNVVLVANCQHNNVSLQCIAECSSRLQQIMNNGKLVLDAGFVVLNQYQNKTQSKTGNRSGDAFVKWALRNRANPARVDLVSLLPDMRNHFREFPQDKRLEKFDAADRVFIALANKHPGKPPVLQATDSKWLNYSSVLQAHGISVEFLCSSDIRSFHEKKFG